MDHPSSPRLWRNRDFLLLWSGQSVSVLGTKVSGLALPLLVLATTHSAAQAGLITSARMVPYLFLGLPAGALMDRWNRKVAMIICDVARFFALGSVPLAWAMGHLTIAQLYLVALIQGTAFVIFNVAEMASLPNVVAREDLPQATALDSLAGSGASLIGPGLSGLIISAARTTPEGAVMAYLVDAVTYLISVISLGFIRVPFQADREVNRKRNLYKDILEGLRFLWDDRRLRALALTSWTLSLLYAPVPLAMIVLARDQMHASAGIIGMIFSLSAIGGLVGASMAVRLKTRLPFGYLVIGPIVIQALATPLVALAVTPAMMIAGWSIAFMCDPVLSMASTSYRLAVTPDDLRGRVHGVYRLGGYGAEPLGAALGGVLLGVISPRVEILAVAVGVGLCALGVGLSRLRVTHWPHLETVHEHAHTHQRLEHSHLHTHDEHHQHHHETGVDPSDPHSHPHVHESLSHSHSHIPDLHHRHRDENANDANKEAPE
ncbi:MAG TPA: MFS transporter [Armatimonadota bacterium]|nr:MFS transporter [Armatimonadota bacterium]